MILIQALEKFKNVDICVWTDGLSTLLYSGTYDQIIEQTTIVDKVSEVLDLYWSWSHDEINIDIDKREDNMKLYQLIHYMDKEQNIDVWTDKGLLIYTGRVKDFQPSSWWENKFIKLEPDKRTNSLHLFIKE